MQITPELHALLKVMHQKHIWSSRLYSLTSSNISPHGLWGAASAMPEDFGLHKQHHGHEWKDELDELVDLDAMHCAHLVCPMTR